MDTADWFQTALTYIEVIVLVGYIALIIWAAIKILLENKNPLKTHSYLLLLILVPVIGLLFYMILGQDYRRNKLFSRKKALDEDLIDRYAEEQLEQARSNQLIIDERIKQKSRIINLLISNNRAFLSKNNKIELLINGENKFPKLLEDISKAQHHIHIEYYILDNDVIGRKVVDALCEHAGLHSPA